MDHYSGYIRNNIWFRHRPWAWWMHIYIRAPFLKSAKKIQRIVDLMLYISIFVVYNLAIANLAIY